MRRLYRIVPLVVLSLALGACHSADTLEILWERDPRVLYSVGTDEPFLALTLDDGPHPVSTRRLLEVLEAHEARATFFLIAERIPGNEAVVEAIVAAGHEIANHGTRDEPSVDLGPERFESELLRAHETLTRFAPSRWFRPGSGWYDDWMFPILERHGYRLALGNAYPLDASLRSVWLSSRVTLWRADRGGIIILHDVGERGERTARTLERVLPKLRGRGLRIVTLSELVENGSSAVAVTARREP